MRINSKSALGSSSCQEAKTCSRFQHAVILHYSSAKLKSDTFSSTVKEGVGRKMELCRHAEFAEDALVNLSSAPKFISEHIQLW